MNSLYDVIKHKVAHFDKNKLQNVFAPGMNCCKKECLMKRM